MSVCVCVCVYSTENAYNSTCGYMYTFVICIYVCVFIRVCVCPFAHKIC